MTEAALLRVDGVAAAGVPADDRGLAYGDGVFETLLLHGGRVVWWAALLQRLELGCAALGLGAPSRRLWRADLDALLAAAGPGRRVLKLTASAGSGRRGYRRDAAEPVRRIARLLPAPPSLPACDGGIAVRWCELRLAAQPRLAGLKHLNRLEQVLARAEWDDPAIAEGLLCDGDGNLVSATAANLFVVVDGRLLTPPLEQCGVAGTCRQFLLPAAEVRRLSPQDLLAADEVFVCNSLRGILPVTRLGTRRWPIGPVTRAQGARLAAAEPAFAVEW